MTLFPGADPSAAADDRLLVDVGWATATGPRPDNQDRAAVTSRWAVVSDGAGGHRGGALAAQLTVDAVVARLASAVEPGDETTVGLALDDANAAVRAGRNADPTVASMAATLIVAVARAVDHIGSSWTILGVGDSPAWLVTGGRLRRVSEDDNLAAELVRAGAISRAEARHHPGRFLITKAIGTDDTVTASPLTVSLRPGDGLVLATDGVDVLDEAVMMEVISTAPDAAQAARRLVDAALARGATDNVTVAVLAHRDEPGPGGDAERARPDGTV